MVTLVPSIVEFTVVPAFPALSVKLIVNVTVPSAASFATVVVAVHVLPPVLFTDTAPNELE